MKYITMLNGEQYEVEIDKDGQIFVNGEQRHVDFLTLGPSLYSVISENKSLELVIEDEAGKVSVLMNGRLYETQVLDERAMLMAQRKGGLGGGSGEVCAPMPGLIVLVKVEVGDVVEAGQTIVILESMKMQNELKSPIAGTVKSVNALAGQTVDKNAFLVSIEAHKEDEA